MLGRIRRAGRRGGEGHPLVEHRPQPPQRDIRFLCSERHLIHHLPVRTEQAHVLPGTAQPEVRVPAFRCYPVGTGDPDHQKGARRQRRDGYGPLGRLGGVVGEGVAEEGDRHVRGVVQLDPVGVATLVVGRRARIRRLDLGDEDTGGGGLHRRQAARQPEQEQAQHKRATKGDQPTQAAHRSAHSARI